MTGAFRWGLAALAALAASACSHLPDVATNMPGGFGARVTPDLAPRERVRLAVELLGQGEERRAKAELEAALEEQPRLPAARRLLEQIDGDPRALLGADARPHTVRQGETMSTLAERYLGDGMLFYALARYNNIDAPNALTAGQTLMIPRRAGAAVVTATASAPPASSAPPVVSAAPNAVRGVDPARASELRLQALRHMNAGQVDRAVVLLRQARTLDAGNASIQRDLARAERLQASLSAPSGGAVR